MPKRIVILILALILTLGFAVDANAGYKTLIKTGTVTLDNCRVSYVAGTAFIDGSDILTSYIGHWVELVADGKRVAGVVKAAGGGETLGAAKTVVGITKANPGVITFSAGHGLSNGMVIKFVGLTEMTELNGKYRVLTNNSGDTFQLGDTSSFSAAETTGGDCANQVTVPAATGVTIVSQAYGSTYNFNSVETAFDPNYTTGFTYYIYSTGSKIAASGTVTANTAKMDCTTTNAFADFGSVLATYAGLDDGIRRYLLVVIDSAGKVFRAWIGAEDAAESLAAAKDVDGITKANPGVITYAAGHGYVNGQVIYFSGLTEMTDLNTKYRTLYDKSSDTFKISDTSSFAAAETTGGNCSQSVTHVGATGVHLFSTPGYSTHTRSYASMDTGFNPNLALTYKIYDTQPDLGELLYTTTIAAGSLKADTTDTNAFCDWGSTVPLSGFAGVDGYTPYLLVLQDSLGKIKYGYVSVADSGEALSGVELITNGDNEAAVYTPTTLTRATIAQSADFAHAGSNSAKLTNTSTPDNTFSAYTGITSIVGSVYKAHYWTYNPTGNANTYKTYMRLNASSYVGSDISTKDAWVENSVYGTALSASDGFAGVLVGSSAINKVFYLDDLSLQALTNCATTGCLIVSTKNGATRAWAGGDSTFNPNLAVIVRVYKAE